MSSNCPPQLHLSLPSNVTSFKRSFEQFGFDLESPTIVGSTDLGGSVSSQSTSSGSDGNERNKRARSASSASHSSGTMEHHPQSPLPLITSPASNSAISVIENGVSEGSGLATTRPPTLTLNTHRYAYPTQTPSFLEPLRLPTPEMQDIVMSGFPSATIRRSSSPGSPPLTTSGHDIQYRISLERFNTFDSHISALRQSRSPALRLPTPPPILPPLALASDTGDRNGLHAMPTSASSVLASPPEALLPRSLYNINLPSDSRSQMSDRDNRVENYESRLAGRVWPPGSPNSTLGSRVPLMDTSHHDPNSPIVSFMSAPRTVARESSPTTPSDEVHTTNWSLPPRPRVRPSEHMIFRDRLDSALDVLRSPSPLFSEMDYRPLGSTFVGHIHGDQTWEGSSAPFRAPASSSSQSERLSSERGRRIEPQPESGMHVPPRSHGMSTLGPARGTSSRTRTGMRRFSFERPRQTDRETDAVMSDLDLALLPPYRPFYHGSSDTRSTRGDSGFYALRLTDSAALSDQGDERSHFRPEHSHTEDLTARHSDHVDFENSHLPYSEGMAGPDHNHDGAPGWRVGRSRASRPPSFREPSSFPSSVFSHRTTGLSASNGFRRLSDIPGLTAEADSLRLQNPTLASLHRNSPRARNIMVGASNSLTETLSQPGQRVTRDQLTLGFNDDRAARLDDPSDRETVWRNNEIHPRLHRRRDNTQPLNPRGHARPAPPPRAGHSYALGINTSPSPGATMFTSRNPTSSFSRDHGDSHTSLRIEGRDSVERRWDLPPLPSVTPLIDSHPRGLFDSYLPSFAEFDDGPTNFDAARGPSGQEYNIATSARAALLVSPSSSSPGRDEFMNPSHRHTGNRTSSHDFHGTHSSLPSSLPMPDLTSLYSSPLHTAERNHSNSSLQPDTSSDTRVGRRSRLTGTSRLPSSLPREPESRSLGTSPRPSASGLPGPSQSSTHQNIDLNAYHDGPFRASLQRFVELDRIRVRLNRLESLANEASSGTSNPPSIPPLRFEDDFLPFNPGDSHSESGTTAASVSSLRDWEARQRRVPDMMHPSRTGMDQHDNPFRESRMSDIPSRNRLIFRAPVGSTRAYEDGVQDRRDMYNFISRQSRIEPSRIEDGENPPQRQGQVDAIHVLHGDGRNSTRQQQLIERFQRDRNQSQERQRPTPSFWGDVEGDNEGSQFFPSRPRHLARSGRGVTGFDRYHPTVDISRSARTNPTAPGPTSRHRPLSHSPVRDDSSRHERLIAVARLRARLHLDSESLSGNLPRMELFNHPTPRRRGRAFGDYMRDEDFDSSYENLLSMATALGEAKSRAVPEHIIASQPTASYKDWATPGSDLRCPICLDDYKPLDRVLKLSDCSHWLHKSCLEQWLRGASTCPVCRNCVKSTRDHNHGLYGPESSNHIGGEDDE